VEEVGLGMVTTSGVAVGKALPWPLYSVATPAPLSATQKGDVELNPSPQGLTRFGSVKRATPSISETRFTRVKICPGLGEGVGDGLGEGLGDGDGDGVGVGVGVCPIMAVAHNNSASATINSNTDCFITFNSLHGSVSRVWTLAFQRLPVGFAVL